LTINGGLVIPNIDMKILTKLLNKNLKETKDKIIKNTFDRSLSNIGREQFLKLKEKGLQIRIFTL
jgi:hypothetical protein